MSKLPHHTAVRKKSRFKVKLISLAIVTALTTACDGSGNAIISGSNSLPPAENNLTTGTTAGINTSTSNGADISIEPNASVLIGQFIDSPVANMNFSTPSGSGRTNENGEYYYRAGEQITFSIGGLTLPSVSAQEQLTPLDLFNADSVTDTQVTNLSRLLQTLDVDANPDNGIILPDAAEQLGIDTSIVFNNDQIFESSATAALENAGLNASIVSSAEALTHLSNSLLEEGLIDVSQISTAAVQFDESTIERQLPDLDGDGIADIFDWDDDGDEVADRLDTFPQNGAAAFDFDGDGIANSFDNDDDNDGILDENDAFPLIALESQDTDGDGFGDTLDTDDDNDGVPDIFDAYPLDPLEQQDTDGDGIGNATDSDDDGDDVADGQDAFPLLASESQDTDNDGLGNNFDQDDDNDGVPDSLDQFPEINSEQLDTDNDGTGNNADLDDDNDSYADALDAFPLIYSEQLDTDSDGLGDNFDLDDDGDGVPDSLDAFPNNAAEQLDTDNDGIGNNADEDDDGDGLEDSVDPFPLAETNATDLDGDGFADNIDDDNDNDGVHDALDVFPNDASEYSDNDKDGIGDNADPDDDNDGTIDTQDALPLNPAETSDYDGDGIGDNADNDSDNDEVEDSIDAFPLDPAESVDTDGDGTGDNADLDDDDDGTPDATDAFPLNPYETLDGDGDGIGDNSDDDRDNDGFYDYWDAFPDDPAESSDIDEDGIGDNADLDDDNDGTLDVDDPYPQEAYYGADTDNDGEPDQWDFDDDNDGVPDYDDALPKDATESIDSDADGIGNNADPDDDNDGVDDIDDLAPLNSNCHSVDESFGGVCIADFLQNIDYIEQIGESAFLFNASATAVMQVQLSTQDILTEIDLSAHIDPSDTITAVKYIPSHGRVYVGYSSGVIVYFDSNSTQASYFHTSPETTSAFAEAGNFVLAQSNRYDTTYILDQDGIQVAIDSFSFNELSLSAWNATTSTLYFQYWTDDLASRVIDQTTGAVISNGNLNNSNRLASPLKLSPDNSLLLSASGQTFLIDDNITTGGIISSNNFKDFNWNDAGEIISIQASGEDTIVQHYTTSFDIAESLTFEGSPRKIFKEGNSFYVLTETTTGLVFNNYTPSPDSDNDLVLNTDDAFPTDPAASIDSDNDGSPDSWNIGYTQTDSTSGLIIDAYPADPACFLTEDGNGEHCHYDLIVPIEAPTTVISEDNLTYLHYENGGLIFVRDNTTDTYLTPLIVGEEDSTQTLYPQIMTHHAEHNRLYFGYASGNVTYLDLNVDQPVEQHFVTLAESVRAISNAGAFVMFVDNSGAWESHHYYNIDGNLTQSEDWNYFSRHFAWSEINNRLYFFRDSSSPNDLHYEEISADGLILSDGESPYHGDYSIFGPIVLSPDETNVLLGAGEYYDPISLSRVGSISRTFDHATYLSDGRLAIVKENGVDTILAYYDTAYAPIAGVTTFQGAAPVGISYHNDTLTVITYSLVTGLVYHDIPNP